MKKLVFVGAILEVVILLYVFIQIISLKQTNIEILKRLDSITQSKEENENIIIERFNDINKYINTLYVDLDGKFKQLDEIDIKIITGLNEKFEKLDNINNTNLETFKSLNHRLNRLE